MTRNTQSIWRLGNTSLSLLAAIAAYSIARIILSELLEPIQATSTLFAVQSGFFGSAFSFFYTLAIGLLIGACASTRSSTRVHYLSWIGVAVGLEPFCNPLTYRAS